MLNQYPTFFIILFYVKITKIIKNYIILYIHTKNLYFILRILILYFLPNKIILNIIKF